MHKCFKNTSLLFFQWYSVSNDITSISLLHYALSNSMAYGTRKCNVAFTRALQQSPFWDESTEFLVLISISLRSNLILSSHLCLGLANDLFPVGLSAEILKALLPSYNLTTWRAHLNILDLITLTLLGERYKLWSSLLWSLLHSPVSWLLGPSIHLKILFSNTLSLHSSTT